MSVAHDAKLRRLAQAAQRDGMPLEEGCTRGCWDRSYETPAEFSGWSGLASMRSGMSTVLEVIAARARRMKVSASTITNLAAERVVGKLSHAEVMEVCDSRGRPRRATDGRRDRVDRVIDRPVPAPRPGAESRVAGNRGTRPPLLPAEARARGGGDGRGQRTRFRASMRSRCGDGGIAASHRA